MPALYVKDINGNFFAVKTIVGPKGETGDRGPAGPAGKNGENGARGPTGENGKSAYQYAQEGGYTGTESEFAAKLAAEYRPASWTPTASDVGALPLTGGTMTGEINMGQNLITNLPGPTGDNNAARKKYVDDKFADATKITKLWENASPGSTFDAQELAITLSGYRFVIITARASTTSSVYASWACVIGKLQSISAYTTKFNFRTASVSSTGVSFGPGKYMDSYGASYVDDNKYAIPVAIYGVK